MTEDWKTLPTRSVRSGSMRQGRIGSRVGRGLRRAGNGRRLAPENRAAVNGSGDAGDPRHRGNGDGQRQTELAAARDLAILAMRLAGVARRARPILLVMAAGHRGMDRRWPGAGRRRMGDAGKRHRDGQEKEQATPHRQPALPVAIKALPSERSRQDQPFRSRLAFHIRNYTVKQHGEIIWPTGTVGNPHRAGKTQPNRRTRHSLGGNIPFRHLPLWLHARKVPRRMRPPSRPPP